MTNEIPGDDEVKAIVEKMTPDEKADFLDKATKQAEKDVEKVSSRTLKIAIAIIHEANRHRAGPAKKPSASSGGRGRKKAEPSAPSINLDDFLK